MSVCHETVGPTQIVNFLDLDLAYEKRPITTAIMVLGSHFLFALLGVWSMSAFPNHAVLIANAFGWVWLAWAIISVVGTVRYLEKLIERKK